MKVEICGECDGYGWTSGISKVYAYPCKKCGEAGYVVKGENTHENHQNQ